MTIKITDQFILSTQGEKPLNKILANILNSIYFLNMPHQVQIRVYSSPGRTIRKKKICPEGRSIPALWDNTKLCLQNESVIFWNKLFFCCL